MTTKSDLKQLTKLRLKEATVLFDKKCYNGAIYIGGYVIELSLKVKICSLLSISDFPPRKDLANFKTHDIETLILLAGLKQKLIDKINTCTTPDFEANWNLLKLWNEQLRYTFIFDKRNATQKDASDFLNAITNNTNGIYTWIKKIW